jgi:hypothetical protein
MNTERLNDQPTIDHRCDVRRKLTCITARIAVVFALLIAVQVIALLLLVAPHSEAAPPARSPDIGPVRASAAITMDQFTFLPLIIAPTHLESCQGITRQTYETLSVNPPPTDRPADQHADLNLGLRGYTPTVASLSLVNLGGSSDSSAPQFPGFFGDDRTPQFTSAARVFNWDWGCNCPTTPISSPAATLLGMATEPGEIIGVPGSGYAIGSGFNVLVLHAAPGRITLKYTRDDNVINGYTIHVEKLCVEPELLSLYIASNAAGRGSLPALRAGQPFGRAAGGEIQVALQDSGAWMDPRSRKDWWQGR